MTEHCTYLVNTIISVSIFWRILGVLATFGIPNDPYRLAGLPILGFISFDLVSGGVAITSKGPANEQF